MDNDEGAVFLIGIAVGLIAGLAIMNALTVDFSDVASGKNFISRSATYKCTKTNELKGEK